MNNTTSSISADEAAELASFAMLLEVCAKNKPGNVDREHDYADTRLEHFLCSATRARPVFEQIDELPLGQAMYDAVLRTNNHSGGNTHFGAFILLLPLLKGRGIEGAKVCVKGTTVEDAVMFYQAFGLTSVRVNKTSDMDINDPATLDKLRAEGKTMYDVMAFSAPNDMVCREWINGFELTRKFADGLKAAGGASEIPTVFLEMLASYPDTFVIKKLGAAAAEELRSYADEIYRRCRDGLEQTKKFAENLKKSEGAAHLTALLKEKIAAHPKASLVTKLGAAAASELKNRISRIDGDELSAEILDAWCLTEGINPGSLADICIAGVFVALLEGWNWDS
ncbi:MAG TPA: triphosphoribosyl-dephospho-CoA synthase [Methanocorpusculum sp.]|nr:triphosphoribosyl-dephospho-CoA synthase [Methanocorpusculum sp.]